MGSGPAGPAGDGQRGHCHRGHDGQLHGAGSGPARCPRTTWLGRRGVRPAGCATGHGDRRRGSPQHHRPRPAVPRPRCPDRRRLRRAGTDPHRRVGASAGCDRRAAAGRAAGRRDPFRGVRRLRRGHRPGTRPRRVGPRRRRLRPVGGRIGQRPGTLCVATSMPTPGPRMPTRRSTFRTTPAWRSWPIRWRTGPPSECTPRT